MMTILSRSFPTAVPLARCALPRILSYRFSSRKEEPNEETTTAAARILLEKTAVHCIVGNSNNDKNASSHGNDIVEERYGTREYVLLPLKANLSDLKHNKNLKLASIRAHRNIIFAANVYNRSLLEQYDNGNITEVCSSLLDEALEDAYSQGEQPQAMCSLEGLCDWVSHEIQTFEQQQQNMVVDQTYTNEVLASLHKNNFPVYEAVKAIATLVPRPGHSVVGGGTYRDGKEGWEELSKEYVKRGNCVEAKLYESKGAELTVIDYMAHKSPSYMQSAGGAMGRFFFL